MQKYTIYKKFIELIREIYSSKDFIPSHEPIFVGNEKKYLIDVIDSSYVSSSGKYIENFEKKIRDFTKSKYAIATVNGTSALHASLKVLGVEENTEVITQSFTFIATCNAIDYCGAHPVFLDISRETLSLSAEALGNFLDYNCFVDDDGNCINKSTKRKISACMPMHSFGFPAEITKIKKLCNMYNIPLIEDAAESLGSFYQSKHTGNFGDIASLSFNGNKIITTGGGGMIITNNKKLFNKAKHIISTSRKKHKWMIEHDDIGYNYRMPNINAALGLAQIENINQYLNIKREIAGIYIDWGLKNDCRFFEEPINSSSNYWLNTMITESAIERDRFLRFTNSQNINTRTAWTPMHKLKMYEKCQKFNLKNTDWAFERIVNVPSSVKLNTI